MIVDLTGSTPFIILAITIIPLTRLVTGTSAGTSAAIVPLAIVATSLVAKIVEGAIRDVDQGLIEASRAMGATPLQIALKVLLPEARQAILLGFTVSLVSLFGNAAIVGAVGGGGLGDLSIRFGYQHFTPEIMAAVIYRSRRPRSNRPASWRPAGAQRSQTQEWKLSPIKIAGLGKPHQLCSPSCLSGKHMIGRVDSSENFRLEIVGAQKI